MHPSPLAPVEPAERLPAVDPLRRAGLKPIGFAVGVLGVAGALAVGSASSELPVLCVFRRCTGGYCPGCGGSRAVAALARGDLAGAWIQHPWVVLLAAQFVVVIGAVLGGGLQLTHRLRNRLLMGNTILGVAIWIVRLFAGQIPVPGLPFL